MKPDGSASPAQSVEARVHSTLIALQGAAKRVAAGRRPRWSESTAYIESWRDRLEPIVFGTVALWALAMIGIGMWTVLHWIWG